MTSPRSVPWSTSSLRRLLLVGLAAAGSFPVLWSAPTGSAVAHFEREVQPLLKKYCYDCHADGIDKGGVAFDGFATSSELVGKHSLWLAALKNTRAGLMPPREQGVDRPSAAELEVLANWIKHEAFGIDPRQPDPGRVIVRRLNRVEYRNTIRDLMGIDFNTEAEFPPDDSGGGFDNNGEVLTISPLLLEKYLAAAEAIVERAVPKVAAVMPEKTASGRDFRAENGGSTGDVINVRRALTVKRNFTVEKPGRYQLAFELEARGSFDFDPGQGTLVCRVDGRELFREEIAWSERRVIRHQHEFDGVPGKQVVSFEMIPAAGSAGQAQPVEAKPGTRVDVRIQLVQLRGPLDPKAWNRPENHARFFPRGPAPSDEAGRDRYAREVLGAFSASAFRRPVDKAKVEQLAGLAAAVYRRPGHTFEEGVGRAMMAVLASPRFLFRAETSAPEVPAGGSVAIDEYSLASRISYFLWSSMPDEELIRLAAAGRLRAELRGQVTRMLADAKAQAFVRNFTGQWLQARDVESVPINARVVLGPNAVPNRDGRIEFDGAFRRAMRSETEMCFDLVLREDRSVLELIDANYTFVNERLAQHYGLTGVSGEQLRRVDLPPESPRGGVLTQGTVLAVTSNPTRTSPVKRGLFILDNILGTPPPPPPPDVPELEEAKKEFKGREPRLSEMLALHRSNAACSSCHERMDPLGLALENFNALGGWRDTEARQPIEVSGHLVTGEVFGSVRELKKILVNERRADFYRCLTEKMMAYALGRGVDYHDVHTVDEITRSMEANGGRISVLIHGLVESPAFQRRRVAPAGSLTSLSP